MNGDNEKSDVYEPAFGDIISLEEAAKISGLSHGHLALLIRKGELWGKKIGRNWVTTEKAVREYQARNLRPGPKPEKSRLGAKKD